MKGQTDDAETGHSLEVTANEEGELVQSSVVPWPLPLTANTASLHSHTKIHTGTDIQEGNDGTKMAEIAPESHRTFEMRDDRNMSLPSLDEDKSTTKSDGPLMTSSHTETPTADLGHLTKEQQLQEEERLLLAKINLMTGDTSPVSGPRSMKLLIPDPCDIDCDSRELVEHSQSLLPCCDTLQEISLTEEEEPRVNELRQNQGQEDV